jgi:hypothetical protein
MEHQRKIIKDDNKDNIEDKYKIYITYFSNKTEYENKNKKYIGSKKKVNVNINDIVVMINLDSKEMFGVARITQKCIEPHPYDSCDIYTGKDVLYNKYEIGIDNIFYLKNRISLKNIRDLLGGFELDKYKTNIYKGFPSSWIPAFVKNDENQSVIDVMTKFYNWIQTYV